MASDRFWLELFRGERKSSASSRPKADRPQEIWSVFGHAEHALGPLGPIIPETRDRLTQIEADIGVIKNRLDHHHDELNAVSGLAMRATGERVAWASVQGQIEKLAARIGALERDRHWSIGRKSRTGHEVLSLTALSAMHWYSASNGWSFGMPTLTVRTVDASIARALRVRAAEQDVSAEDLHRRILSEALGERKTTADPVRTLRRMGRLGLDLDGPVAEGPERGPPRL